MPSREAWSEAWARPGRRRAVPPRVATAGAGALLVASAWLSWIVPVSDFGGDPAWLSPLDTSPSDLAPSLPSVPNLGYVLLALASLAFACAAADRWRSRAPHIGLAVLVVVAGMTILSAPLLPLVVFSPGLLAAAAAGVVLLLTGAPSDPG